MFHVNRCEKFRSLLLFAIIGNIPFCKITSAVVTGLSQIDEYILIIVRHMIGCIGDSWEHEIILEKVLPEGLIQTICIAGGGACPPEDCGGVHGFADFKLAVDDPDLEDNLSIREWVGLSEGKKWNVHEIDQDMISSRLAKRSKSFKIKIA